MSGSPTSDMLTMPTDVLVIGGGPAGLAAAIAARLKGFEVTLADAAHPPIDKACGEGILPVGVEVLRRLGVALSTEDAFPIRGIRFCSDGTCVEAKFQSGFGMAIRRTRLHGILAERAGALGVRLAWGTRITDSSSLPSCRWIVGADGQNSRVRSAAGLDAPGHTSRRFGFRQHYRVAPWTDFVEVHWGKRCQIYVTPVSPDAIGIALLSRDSSLRLSIALQEFPELQTRLAGAETSSTERGGVTITQRLRRVVRGNTILIGDASGSLDAITGEGLSLAFHQALVLAQALRAGNSATYEKEHCRIFQRPMLAATALLALDRFPSLRRGTVGFLSLTPNIFSKLLAIAAGNKLQAPAA